MFANQQADNIEPPRTLPSLSEIQGRFVPVIKNIPVVLRRLWSQCLAQALAQAVYLNNEAGWTELLMLPKSTLCCPVHGGKSHSSQRLAWTRGRLQGWLAWERANLWEGLPSYNSPK